MVTAGNGAPLVVIGGPTGVGKTAVAVELARILAIEIVSADSRQVYRGMDAATGKPTTAERRAVTHHLVDVVEPDEPYHAARFRQEARATIDSIRARGRLAVVVGGTGLYIRALLRGLDPMPPADPAFRAELAGVLAREGAGALHARLAEAAPELGRRLHPNDRVRVVRALELLRAGVPAGEAQRAWRRAQAEDVLYVGLTMEREALAHRLRARAAAMVAAGLAEEVRTLLARGFDPALPALLGIGYREFVQVVRGTLGEAEALARMQRDTVRYAKRQWTWFRREPGIEWLDVAAAGGPARVAAALARRLAAGEVMA